MREISSRPGHAAPPWCALFRDDEKSRGVDLDISLRDLPDREQLVDAGVSGIDD
jgi:hypothetical protein